MGARLHRIRARALSAMGRDDEAQLELLTGLEIADRRQDPYETAMLTLALADLERRLGSRLTTPQSMRRGGRSTISASNSPRAGLPPPHWEGEDRRRLLTACPGWDRRGTARFELIDLNVEFRAGGFRCDIDLPIRTAVGHSCVGLPRVAVNAHHLARRRVRGSRRSA